ncbi:histidine kinase [Algoriphagus sp. NG3]|uniref:histidine kinase n=1 Tax=unclassified Algoriphagus TaxID=2641541 RepID=UPI002A7EF398|nr:histidine kinase [Algoriphagus sp. NG3]WPR76037.1 histidine kinase [Algoriphagus sp. NG3]
MSYNQYPLPDNQFGRLNRWFSTIFRWPLLLLLLPWLVYFILDLITTLLILDVNIELGIPILHAVFGFLVLIVFFYFSFDYTILKKNYLSGEVYTLLLLCGITSIKYLWIAYLNPAFGINRVIVANEMMRLFHFMGFSFFVWMCYRYYLSVQHKLKVKVKLTELEMAHVSLQLSPHFTMNVLNELLAKVTLVSKPVFFTLSRMSRILKYHYFSTEKSDQLEEELSIVNEYLELQQQRFNCPLHLDFKANTPEGVTSNLFIPKKLLLTLVENVFKHGDVRDSDFPPVFSTSIYYTANGSPAFLLSIVNKLKAPHSKIDSTGFGIKAVCFLLEAYFPGRNFVTQSFSEFEHALLLVIEYEIEHVVTNTQRDDNKPCEIPCGL